MVRSYLIEDRIRFDSDSGSGGGVSAPRRTEIRGQDHMLAYITPEEGTILKAFGGSGDPGPMGIPAYAEDDGDEDGSSGAGHGGGSDSDDVGGGAGGGDGSGGGAGGGDGSAQAGDTSTSDAETDDPATAGAGSTEANDQSDPSGYQGSVGPGFGGYVGGPDYAENYAQKVAALEQLNKDLYDLSRREQKAKDIPGIFGVIASKNVRSLAEQLVGKDLNADQMADRQSRGIRGETGKDPFGRSTTGIVGFRDEAGNVAYGRDPNEDTTSGGDGFDEFNNIRRRGSDGLPEDTEDAPTVIDDFAVNYLRNPYFAYSGFGNQYNPYGYANSTLVDLLQTRGMTQPSQADTLGLFADPRDFR